MFTFHCIFYPLFYLLDLLSISALVVFVCGELCDSFSRSSGVNGVRKGVGLRKVRLASWNIGFLTGKSIELVKSLRRRTISIACVQEKKWVGAKAREIDGYKLWYSGSTKAKNGVGILVEKELADFVVEVRRKSNRIMAIKVLVGSVFVNVVSI